MRTTGSFQNVNLVCFSYQPCVEWHSGGAPVYSTYRTDCVLGDLRAPAPAQPSPTIPAVVLLQLNLNLQTPTQSGFPHQLHHQP